MTLSHGPNTFVPNAHIFTEISMVHYSKLLTKSINFTIINCRNTLFGGFYERILNYGSFITERSTCV